MVRVVAEELSMLTAAMVTSPTAVAKFSIFLKKSSPSDGNCACMSKRLTDAINLKFTGLYSLIYITH